MAFWLQFICQMKINGRKCNNWSHSQKPESGCGHDSSRKNDSLKKIEDSGI